MLSGIFMGVSSVSAQIVLPEDHPRSSVSQDLGFNRITVEYNRPATEGHIIFGERVAYGEPWLLDGREHIQLKVSGKLILEGMHELYAGNYFLSAIPGKDSWTILVHDAIMNANPSIDWPEVSLYSLDNMQMFGPGDELFRFKVTPEKMCEKVESLTVQFANACSTCASMQIAWDYTRVSFDVSTEVDSEIIREIDAFTNNPELKMAGQYYLAAKYYLDTNRDLDKALEWVDKSLQYAPDAYWVLHTKAEILAGMKDYNAAIKAAEESMDLAKEKQDMDYVRINQMEIERWKDLRKAGL